MVDELDELNDAKSVELLSDLRERMSKLKNIRESLYNMTGIGCH